MKNNKVLITLVIILALLNVFSLGFIWFGHINKHRHGNSHQREKNRSELFLKKEIGLSQEQLDKFKKARRSHFEKIRPIERKLKEEKKKLFKANVNNENPEALEPVFHRIGDLQIKVDSLTYLHFSELRSYCEDSQIEAFDKMLGRMLSREFGRTHREKSDKKN